MNERIKRDRRKKANKQIEKDAGKERERENKFKKEKGRTIKRVRESETKK